MWTPHTYGDALWPDTLWQVPGRALSLPRTFLPPFCFQMPSNIRLTPSSLLKVRHTVWPIKRWRVLLPEKVNWEMCVGVGLMCTPQWKENNNYKVRVGHEEQHWPSSHNSSFNITSWWGRDCISALSCLDDTSSVGSVCSLLQMKISPALVLHGGKNIKA